MNDTKKLFKAIFFRGKPSYIYKTFFYWSVIQFYILRQLALKFHVLTFRCSWWSKLRSIMSLSPCTTPPQGHPGIRSRRQMKLAWTNSTNFRSSLAVPGTTGVSNSSGTSSPASNPTRLLSKTGRRSNKAFSRGWTFSASSTHNR